MLRQLIRESLLEEPIRQPLEMELPDEVLTISDIFQRAGHKLYVVGGAVRDALMGKVPKDVDLATDAVPDRVIELLQDTPGFKLKEVGKAFGVVIVTGPSGEDFEVATFRQDIGSGRRPSGGVNFVTIDQDVSRRDLTINALFYDIERGEVVDYVGGIEDIRTGNVRAVGDAGARFKEDRLRILRAARFAGRFGSEIDPETTAAIRADNRLTGVGPDDDISPERIRDEFLKGIKYAKSIKHFLQVVDDLGLLDQVFPGLPASRDFTEVRDAPVQLALLLRDAPPAAIGKALNQLKFTADEASQIKFLLGFQALRGPEDAVAFKKAFRNAKLTPEQVMAFTVHAGRPNRDLAVVFLDFVRMPPAASSEELMKQGIKGPALGKALDAADAELFNSLL